MTKPTFVLLPGAWHTPNSYSSLSQQLQEHGYNVKTVSLPTVGTSNPPKTFADDVAAIRLAITKIAEQGNEVVLVMHSYSGMPGSEALQGLGAKERTARGQEGGVVRLVYIMAFIVPEGYQMIPTNQTSGIASYAKADVSAGISTVSSSDGIRVFYNDLKPVDARHWSFELQPSSLSMFWSKTTYAAWRYIPSTYVLCERDMAFPMVYVEGMLNKARSEEVNMIDTVERVDSGHFPWLSQEAWVVVVLRQAAGEDISRM